MVEPKRKMTDDPVIHRIVGLLKERQMTEKELIQKLGMSRSTFSAWKYGYMKSYQAHINEIADILETSPNYLMRGVDDEVNVETLSEAERQLIKDYRTVGNDGQRHINEMVAYIVKAKKKEGGRVSSRKSAGSKSTKNPRS